MAMAPLTYFCIHCWTIVDAATKLCPACGLPIEDGATDIVDKYIAALRHPAPETRLRAAWMLGEMRERRAVPALLDLVSARGRGDVYLLTAAIRSLGAIGAAEAVPVLSTLLADESAPFMAQHAAEDALRHIRAEADGV